MQITAELESDFTNHCATNVCICEITNVLDARFNLCPLAEIMLLDKYLRNIKSFHCLQIEEAVLNFIQIIKLDFTANHLPKRFKLVLLRELFT